MISVNSRNHDLSYILVAVQWFTLAQVCGSLALSVWWRCFLRGNSQHFSGTGTAPMARCFRLLVTGSESLVRKSAFRTRQFPTLISLFIFVTSWFQPAFATGTTWGIPVFNAPISNVTVSVGREAILECAVNNLSSFKVAWLRVDTQTILTIHGHVITKNHRVAVSHSDHRIWYLHIRDVRESDRGWYMCQINTEPMISQVGFVNVVVPPDILDHPTSSDMVVREGSSVILKCAATGYPEPSIVWKREEAKPILLDSGDEVSLVEGGEFRLNRVTRLHMGPYLCIASNGVPPTVSKRIMLIVQFPPMIWIQNQLVGASEKQEVTLECYSEAYPKSINYWTKDDGRIITQGAKYEPHMDDNAYKVHMKLTIRAVSATDFGSYKCISKNSLGETDGTIKLYHVPSPSPSSSATKATEVSSSRRNNFGDSGNSVDKGFLDDGIHTNSKESQEQAVLAGSDHLQQNRPTMEQQLTVISNTNSRCSCNILFDVFIIWILIINI